MGADGGGAADAAVRTGSEGRRRDTGFLGSEQFQEGIPECVWDSTAGLLETPAAG